MSLNELVSPSPSESRDVAMVRSCPVCGLKGIASGNAVPGKRDIKGNQLVLLTCTGCGAVFQPVRIEVETLVEWYDYMGHDLSTQDISPLGKRRLERLLRSLTPYRQNGRLLEIGSGFGFLARIALSQDWEVYATEISPSCCQALRLLLGSRLYQGELPGAELKSGSFDVVVMMEVLEHLPEPLSYLEAAKQALRPGGCILLTTPNFRGLSSRRLGLDWRVVTNEHLNYFDRTTIHKMLKIAGYEAVSIRTTGVDMGAKSLVRSKKCMPQRSKTSTGHPQDMERASAQLKSAIFDLVMECGNRILDGLGLGDTLKVMARKPLGDA